MGVNPDYGIELRCDILDEEDGPMLVHGLQEFHGEKIFVPRSAASMPDRDALAERYAVFRAAG